MRRVDGEDLADDEPVEQHADRGQMLLDRGLAAARSFTAGLPASDTFSALYTQRHGRARYRELANTMLPEPSEERADGPGNRPCGCCRSRSRRRKIKKAARRAVAGLGDHRRDESELSKVGVVIGVTVSTTAGRLCRSALTATPYSR